MDNVYLVLSSVAAVVFCALWINGMFICRSRLKKIETIVDEHIKENKNSEIMTDIKYITPLLHKTSDLLNVFMRNSAVHGEQIKNIRSTLKKHIGSKKSSQEKY
jgi:hypothetical protein